MIIYATDLNISLVQLIGLLNTFFVGLMGVKLTTAFTALAYELFSFLLH